MGFDPCDDLRRVGAADEVVAHHRGVDVVRGDRLADLAAVGAGRGSADGIDILGKLVVAALQHLAVDKEVLVVVDLRRHALPEVICEAVVLLGVVGQADVLRGVIAETVRAAGDRVVDKLEEILLEGRTLGVDVGQAAHLGGGALQTIVPMRDFLVVVLMIKQLQTAAARLNQVLRNRVILRCGVVRDHVDKHLDAVFLRLGAHGGKFLLAAELVVADFEVGRLVVIVPLAVAVQLHAAVLTLETGVDRRGLHRGESRCRDIRHRA